MHITHDNGPCADVNVPTYFGRLIQPLKTTNPECATLPDDCAVDNGGGAVKDNASLMLNHNPPTELSRIRQFNSVDISAPAIPDPIEKTRQFPDDRDTNTHTPNAKPVNRKSPKAGSRPVSSIRVIIF